MWVFVVGSSRGLLYPCLANNSGFPFGWRRRADARARLAAHVYHHHQRTAGAFSLGHACTPVVRIGRAQPVWESHKSAFRPDRPLAPRHIIRRSPDRWKRSNSSRNSGCSDGIVSRYNDTQRACREHEKELPDPSGLGCRARWQARDAARARGPGPGRGEDRSERYLSWVRLF